MLLELITATVVKGNTTQYNHYLRSSTNLLVFCQNVLKYSSQPWLLLNSNLWQLLALKAFLQEIQRDSIRRRMTTEREDTNMWAAIINTVKANNMKHNGMYQDDTKIRYTISLKQYSTVQCVLTSMTIIIWGFFCIIHFNIQLIWANLYIYIYICVNETKEDT